MKFKLIHLLLLSVLFACASHNEAISDQVSVEIQQEADSLLLKVLEAHGDLINFQFDFRGDLFEVTHHSSGFSYTKTIHNDSLTLCYTLTHDGLTCEENGTFIVLSDEEQHKISESINSVVYFVCLPQKLFDPSVILQRQPSIEIKNQLYHVLKVRFNEDGGGKDFQDIFYYWINASTNRVDYFAYQYNVNEGGVRFRQAFNSRFIGGMCFQDYVNYSAPIGTSLDNLPALFEQGKLEQLSLILTEAVLVR